MEYIYAVLLLHKLGKPINDENIKKVVHASGATVDEAKVKSLVASLQGVDIEAELANAIVAGAAMPSSGASAQDKAEEAPKEEKREESVAGLSALFG